MKYFFWIFSVACSSCPLWTALPFFWWSPTCSGAQTGRLFRQASPSALLLRISTTLAIAWPAHTYHNGTCYCAEPTRGCFPASLTRVLKSLAWWTWTSSLRRWLSRVLITWTWAVEILPMGQARRRDPWANLVSNRAEISGLQRLSLDRKLISFILCRLGWDLPGNWWQCSCRCGRWSIGSKVLLPAEVSITQLTWMSSHCQRWTYW